VDSDGVVDFMFYEVTVMNQRQVQEVVGISCVTDLSLPVPSIFLNSSHRIWFNNSKRRSRQHIIHYRLLPCLQISITKFRLVIYKCEVVNI
jgi:hypothetical protein